MFPRHLLLPLRRPLSAGQRLRGSPGALLGWLMVFAWLMGVLQPVLATTAHGQHQASLAGWHDAEFCSAVLDRIPAGPAGALADPGTPGPASPDVHDHDHCSPGCGLQVPGTNPALSGEPWRLPTLGIQPTWTAQTLRRAINRVGSPGLARAPPASSSWTA
jgi:hypothetical protein